MPAVDYGVLANDTIRIDRTIEGDIRAPFVLVGRNASLRGSIYAETVAIAGSVNGTIEAVMVVATRHAHLAGNITCDSLEIEEGAHITARCKARAINRSRCLAAADPWARADDEGR